MELLEILEALNQTHGPSGDEGGVRAKIEELARPFADEIITDTLGNLCYPQLVGTIQLSGGRRHVKKYIWSF